MMRASASTAPRSKRAPAPRSSPAGSMKPRPTRRRGSAPASEADRAPAHDQRGDHQHGQRTRRPDDRAQRSRPGRQSRGLRAAGPDPHLRPRRPEGQGGSQARVDHVRRNVSEGGLEPPWTRILPDPALEYAGGGEIPCSGISCAHASGRALARVKQNPPGPSLTEPWRGRGRRPMAARPPRELQGEPGGHCQARDATPGPARSRSRRQRSASVISPGGVRLGASDPPAVGVAPVSSRNCCPAR